MSERPTYYVAMDEARGSDQAALVFCKLVDGRVEVISCTTDQAEIAALMVDTDHEGWCAAALRVIRKGAPERWFPRRAPPS